MLIRRMQDSDVAAIADIEKDSFGSHAWSDKLFFDELTDNTKFYYVATDGGNLLGYGGFAHILDEAHIMNIAVERAYRKQGIGRALLKAILDGAVSLGASAATLEVRETNAAAVALYESEGFICSGTRRDYYGKGENARIYWLTF